MKRQLASLIVAVGCLIGARPGLASPVESFSDVRPTDWAYQALDSLLTRSACVAGYPSGRFDGARSLTRYEAAALLMRCLDQVSEQTDEVRRLIVEFQGELQQLKDREDVLDRAVASLEAEQFSTTTKLTGVATFVVGGNAFSGSNASIVSDARAKAGAVAFNYDLQLRLDTSFTGKDLLRTTLRAGNFGRGPFSGTAELGPEQDPLFLNQLAPGFQELCGFTDGPSCGDSISLNRLFYQFPVGDDLVFTFGPLVRQDDMLALWPSVYPQDGILQYFAYSGAPGAYNLNLGAGAGLWYEKNGFSLSLNYVSVNGNIGSSAPTGRYIFEEDPYYFEIIDNTGGGIGTAASAQSSTLQLAYGTGQWGAALAYTLSSAGVNYFGTGQFPLGSSTPNAHYSYHDDLWSNAFAVSAYWQPKVSSWWPSVSVGWGLNSVVPAPDRTTSAVNYVSTSWSVGLQWSDVLMQGSRLGFAFGQPTYTTNYEDIAATDANYAWELWYSVPVSDRIAVTPAIFYLSRPLGASTIYGGTQSSTFRDLGLLVKTTFKF